MSQSTLAVCACLGNYSFNSLPVLSWSTTIINKVPFAHLMHIEHMVQQPCLYGPVCTQCLMWSISRCTPSLPINFFLVSNLGLASIFFTIPPCCEMNALTFSWPPVLQSTCTTHIPLLMLQSMQGILLPNYP